MRRHKPFRVLGASLVCFALLGWMAVSLGQEETPAAPAAEAEAEPQAEAPAEPAEAEPTAPDSAEQQEASEHERIMQECQRMCRECAQICNRSSWHAYRMGRSGGAEMALVQQLTGDCQAFCELSARMMERHSPLMAEACAACEKACLACEKACNDAVQKASGERHQLIAQCAEKCKQCSESCKKMVAAMADGGHDEHAGH